MDDVKLTLGRNVSGCFSIVQKIVNNNERNDFKLLYFLRIKLKRVHSQTYVLVVCILISG